MMHTNTQRWVMFDFEEHYLLLRCQPLPSRGPPQQTLSYSARHVFGIDQSGRGRKKKRQRRTSFRLEQTQVNPNTLTHTTKNTECDTKVV